MIDLVVSLLALLYVSNFQFSLFMWQYQALSVLHEICDGAEYMHDVSIDCLHFIQNETYL